MLDKGPRIQAWRLDRLRSLEILKWSMNMNVLLNLDEVGMCVFTNESQSSVCVCLSVCTQPCYWLNMQTGTSAGTTNTPRWTPAPRQEEFPGSCVWGFLQPPIISFTA